jgi:hypothetical protein
MSKRNFFLIVGLMLVVTAPAMAAVATGEPCVVPINPDGSVTLPPEGCAYQSPDDIHVLLKDLPDGTVIHVGASHGHWLCDDKGRETPCTLGGGDLGGRIETWSSTVTLSFSDPGGSWQRTVDLPVDFEVHTGQMSPGQTQFPTLMKNLQGSQVLTGDADFATLEVFAGKNNGFEGDGFTFINNLGNGNAQVDSSFHLGGKLHLVGTPGGRFQGLDATFDFVTDVVAEGPCP